MMTRLDEAIREFADTADTADCVKFYLSGTPEHPIACYIRGVGAVGENADDALRRALAVWAQIRAEAQS
jgi:hypothetical protein